MVKLKDTKVTVTNAECIVRLYNGDAVDTSLLTDAEYRQALTIGLESMQALDKLPVKYIVR